MEEQIQLAGCVITDDYGRLLLLHRYIDGGQWELPGGKVEEGETREAAAVREVQEELGVAVDLVRALGNDVFELSGGEYRYHWFQAVIAEGEPQIMESDKFDDLEFFEIEDLLSLALSPNMQLLANKLYVGEVVLQQ